MTLYSPNQSSAANRGSNFFCKIKFLTSTYLCLVSLFGLWGLMFWECIYNFCVRFFWDDPHNQPAVLCIFRIFARYFITSPHSFREEVFTSASTTHKMYSPSQSNRGSNFFYSFHLLCKPFFDFFASPRWSPLRMLTKVVSFFIFFQELSNKKKIKALQPKMTKIAWRGSCVKVGSTGVGEYQIFLKFSTNLSKGLVTLRQVFSIIIESDRIPRPSSRILSRNAADYVCRGENR